MIKLEDPQIHWLIILPITMPFFGVHPIFRHTQFCWVIHIYIYNILYNNIDFQFPYIPIHKMFALSSSPFLSTTKSPVKQHLLCQTSPRYESEQRGLRCRNAIHQGCQVRLCRTSQRCGGTHVYLEAVAHSELIMLIITYDMFNMCIYTSFYTEYNITYLTL